MSPALGSSSLPGSAVHYGQGCAARYASAPTFSSRARGWLLTVSIGVATEASGPLQADDLLNAADEALYSAKAAGRNRIRLARSLAAPGGEELPEQR